MLAHRRRKKRPNYGIRTVEVDRGANGFGFTISGQQPCILSCIVSNSPAEQAGLKAGDFLISVNGLSVSKVTHDAVVKLIGNSVGPIKMSIAEYYYSDSSDEELPQNFAPRTKPRYPYRPRLHRNHKHDVSSVTCSSINNGNYNYVKSGNKIRPVVNNKLVRNLNNSDNNYYEEYVNSSPTKHVKTPFEIIKKSPNNTRIARPKFSCAGYKVLIGYLGTIEMPSQLQPSTRSHTVSNCIRRFRQEKRSPSTVVMMILPSCVTLTNAHDQTLATYPATRLVYISSSSEKDTCYFGLVTTASSVDNKDSEESSSYLQNYNSSQILAQQASLINCNANYIWYGIDKMNINTELSSYNNMNYVNNCLQSMDTKKEDLDIDVSNSCHVFVIDAKISDHAIHANKASAFNIQCTRDVVTGACLEFPKTSEYIVNLVQKMYGLPRTNNNNQNDSIKSMMINKIPDGINANDQIMANSPQPSASSNSDSGIGFRDECGLVSDRILVVDFPAQPPLPPVISSSSHRPAAIDGSTIAIDSLVRHQSAQKTRTVCSNPHCQQSDIIKDDIRYNIKDDIDSKTSTIVEQIVNSSSNTIEPIPDLIYINSPTNGYSPEIINLKSKSDDFLMINDDNLGNKMLERSKSSDNISVDQQPDIFKTPCTRFKHTNMKNSSSKYQNVKTNSKISNLLSKTNFSHEDLNSFQSEPLLLLTTGDDKITNFGSLQELCVLQNKSLQLTAVSEPDVRFKGFIEDTVCNENILEKLEDVNRNETRTVANWSTGFDKLLEDEKGRETFEEFLKKEFSAENIHFWVSCENYRRLDSVTERAKEAQQIYNKHLCKGATEPVNVDSQARNITQEALMQADRDLFVQAQKQIFNLMKFDSYPRFLKSDLYKKCLTNDDIRQIQNKSETDIHNSTKGSASKLKKSLSNAEDRRRKSLLPWHRKNRSKSKDRGEMEFFSSRSNCQINSSNTDESIPKESYSEENEKDMYNSKSSLTSWDITDDSKSIGENSSASYGLTKNTFCRVILSDGATTVVQIRPCETIREMINRLLDKRGLNYSNYEVYLTNKSKPIDLNKNSLDLAGCEVIIEHRIVFKLDLPNRKIISVKSKPTKMLTDVLRPILHKYGYKLELVRVLETAKSEHCMNLNVPVTAVDGFRIQIQMNTSEITTQEVTNTKQNCASQSLDEITNKVFEELLQVKSEYNRLPHISDQGSLKSEDWGSEHSSGIFGKLLRRDSTTNEKRLKKSSSSRNKGTSSHGSVEDIRSDSNMKKPLIAKWKPGIKLHVTHKPSESDELYEGLKRAQRSRLEDQRGTEINFELPDFLKDKENSEQDKKNRKIHQRLPENFVSELTAKFYDYTENKLHRNDHMNSFALQNYDRTHHQYYIKKTMPPISDENNDNDNIHKIHNTLNQSPTKYLTTSDDSPSKLSNCSSSSSRTGGLIHNLDTTVIENVTVKHLGSDLYEIEPPPLPPKPKVLPIKPSNWKKMTPTIVKTKGKPTTLFLDQPTSSFV